MSKVFKFYRDAGHGWLAVKRQLLEDLGLINSISLYSRVKGKTVYLEEDRDLGIFQNAYEQCGGTVVFEEIDHGDRSWIRNMPEFRTTSNVHEHVDVPLTNEALVTVSNGINEQGKKVNFN